MLLGLMLKASPESTPGVWLLGLSTSRSLCGIRCMCTWKIFLPTTTSELTPTLKPFQFGAKINTQQLRGF